MPEPTVTPYHHFIPTPPPFVSVLPTPGIPGATSAGVVEYNATTSVALTAAIIIGVGVFALSRKARRDVRHVGK